MRKILSRSFIEQTTDSIIGFCVAWALGFYLISYWVETGEFSGERALLTTIIFTAVSFIRGYTVRVSFKLIWRWRDA